MDLVRKTYHKAVSTPLNNVESLWKEYDSYENTLNKLTVRFEDDSFDPTHLCKGEEVLGRESPAVYDCQDSLAGTNEYA
jgi:hypothetical protein